MSELVLLEYQDSWPQQFLQVSEQLRALFPPPGAVLEHIGSTSVPGLCAKPVLDVAVGVATLQDAKAATPALECAGFTYRPEYETTIPDRRYFVKPEDVNLRVHLHALVLGGLLWQQHLHFRDRLRREVRLREDYSDLKRRLSVVHAGNKAAYTEGKAPFIRQVLSTLATQATGPLRSAA
jgi:GrpB-like predicted nucleotidyltransferase (UPF0157 family)